MEWSCDTCSVSGSSKDPAAYTKHKWSFRHSEAMNKAKNTRWPKSMEAYHRLCECVGGYEYDWWDEEAALHILRELTGELDK